MSKDAIKPYRMPILHRLIVSARNRGDGSVSLSMLKGDGWYTPMQRELISIAPLNKMILATGIEKAALVDLTYKFGAWHFCVFHGFQPDDQIETCIFDQLTALTVQPSH